MAYDKIFVIHARLDKRINYAKNADKTRAPESGIMLQAAINCDLQNAYADMTATKKRWDKTTGVLGYHIIHSYKPGEVTPEQAQALGVEFATRLLGDRFEAVVTTHTDHDHLHCHIVFNSVSFVDGRHYRNDFKAYFGDIRGISNEVSRENGLSVIDPKGRGQHYAEWNAERDGKATVRGLIRQDMDAAMADAFTLQSFFAILENRGYAVKRGSNIKHTAVRPPGGSRFVRLDSLGEDYTEDAIRERIAGGRDGHAVTEAPAPSPVPAHGQVFTATMPKHRRYIVRRGHIRRGQKLHGIRALYVRYLFLLGKAGNSHYKKPIPFEVRKEVTKLEKYKRQFCLLQKYRVNSDDELSMLTDALQADIDALTDQRRTLYHLKRQGEDVTSEIEVINLALRPIRREMRLCRQIVDETPRIRAQELQTRQEPENTQQKSKNKERRSGRWKQAAK